MDIIEMLGIHAKGNFEYKDQGQMIEKPHLVGVIAFMLAYISFLVLKYPLWF